MLVISANSDKGGVGKTTTVKNLAEKLSLSSKVLMIDLDDSGNLTTGFGEFESTENTVIDLFEKGDVHPFSIKENLDLIPGHKLVSALKERLISRWQREIILARWIARNYAYLSENYDYILIDTENDEGILTQNALIVSDIVLSIAMPGVDDFSAALNLSTFVNELNIDFDTHTQVLLMANRIDKRANRSKELIQTLERFDNYIGYLPQLDILYEKQSIYSSDAARKNKAGFETVDTFFQNLVIKIQEIAKEVA